MKNYLAALKTVRVNGRLLRLVEEKYGTKGEDLLRFQQEERAHLESLKRVPQEDLNAIAYVAALEAFWKVECVYLLLRAMLSYTDFAPNRDELSKLDLPFQNTTQATYKSGSKKGQKPRPTPWELKHKEVKRAEVKLKTVEARLEIGIEDRWTKDDDEYRTAEGMRRTLDYQKALDKLERLIIQRLFELEKSRMRGTGTLL